MAALAREAEGPQATIPVLDAGRLSTIVLARIAGEPGGVGMSELVRDLAPVLGRSLARPAVRDLAARITAAIEMERLVTREKGRLMITPGGLKQLERLLGSMQTVRGGWPAIRDGLLIAKALGIEPLSPRRARLLMRPDGLRAAIVAAAFDIGTRGAANATRLRNALAAIAIERAFGSGLQREIAAPRDLSAKACRLIAAQLTLAPRDYGSDSRLIARLAGDVLGVDGGGLAALRLGVLRAFVSGRRLQPPTTASNPPPAPARNPVADGRSAAAEGGARPDLVTFARATIAVARPIAEGWSGNRKAYIAHVLTGLARDHADWRLGLDDFKAMLIEAHRHGLLALGTADLRDQRNRPDIDASATVDRNTIWHFVRIDAEPGH